MKNKGLIITLITIFSIIVIALIIFMIGLINGNIKIPSFNFSYKVSNELAMNELYDNTFELIKIDTSASDVTFKLSNDETIRVVIYGNKDKLDVKTNNNQLHINFKENDCVGFCFNRTISKIEIYLPISYNKKIIVNNNYGDISIESFINSDIEINEGSGDVSILGGNKIKVNNDYGDIKIGEAKDIDIKEAAGDVIIENVDNVNVENNYGDVSIKNVRNYLNINSDCGDIEIDNLVLNKDSIISNNYGDVEIKNTNNIYIDAETDLGDIDINNNYHKSDITLTIKNDCGDIEVDN